MVNQIPSINTSGDSSRSVDRSDGALVLARREAEQVGAWDPAVNQALAEKLDVIARSMITQLSTIKEQDEANEIVDMLDQVASSAEGGEAAARNFYGVAGEIASQLHKHLESASVRLGRALNLDERRISVLSFIGKVVNNDFKGDAGRWMVNFGLVSIRTGLSTWAITTLRQQLGTAIEHAFMNSDLQPPAITALSGIALLVGPILNIAGAIVDERNNVATSQSRAGRGSMLLLSLASAGSALKFFSQTQFAASAMCIMSYALLRDLANSQVGLKNNAGGIKMSPTAKAALVYGGAQLLGGEAMDYFAADSGVGAVKAPGQPYPATLTNDMRRGAINAIVEVCDDLVSPALSRRAQVAHNKKTIPADQLLTADIEGLRIELDRGFMNRTVQQQCIALRDQFLTTSAMRVSAFEAVNAMVFAMDSIIGESLDPESKGHAMNAFVALSICCIYPMFAATHYKRDPSPISKKSALDHQLQPA